MIKTITIFLMILFFWMTSQSKTDHDKIIIKVLNSDSSLIKDAIIEISHPIHRGLYFKCISDSNGDSNFEVPFGKYDITISHKNYNQLHNIIRINGKTKIYNYNLDSCKNYSKLTGKILFKTQPSYNPFNGRIKSVMISFHYNMLPIKIDTSGQYVINNVPPGKYLIDCNSWIDFSGSKKIEVIGGSLLNEDIKLEKIEFHQNGYHIYDFQPYNNILEGLQYLPGFFIK